MKFEIKHLKDPNTLLKTDEILLNDYYLPKEKIKAQDIDVSMNVMIQSKEGYVDKTFIKFNHQENIVINSKIVFDVIYNTGKKLFKQVIAKHKKDDKYNWHDLQYQLFTSPSFLTKEYSQWVMDYGYPYHFTNLDDYAYPKDVSLFFYDCVNLYLFFYIYVLIREFEQINNQKLYSTVDLKINMNKLNSLINLIKHDIDDSIASNHNSTLNIDDKLFSHYYKTKYLLQLEQKENNLNYLQYIKRGMVCYIDSLIHGYRKNNFIITKQAVIYFKQSDRYKTYYSATSLMGIAYNQLLNNLTSSEYDFKTKPCKNPKCENIFDAYGNKQYCSDECSKIGEQRRKLEYEKNHNRNKQNIIRKKYNKLLDEMILCQSQNNLSKDIINQIEYFKTKRTNKGISFHDADIENLYKEIKSYLKSEKSNTI